MKLVDGFIFFAIPIYTTNRRSFRQPTGEAITRKTKIPRNSLLNI